MYSTKACLLFLGPEMTHYSIDFGNMAEFDALAQSVQAKLNCKVCLISVVQEDALVALGHASVDLVPVQKAISARDMICAHTVRRGVPVRVPDITKEPFLRTIPTVAALGVEAYIGVPLRLHCGEVVGAICGLSAEPRIWTQGEVDYMLDVADLAESKIERHLLRYEQKALSAALAETDAILSTLAELRDRALTVQNRDGALVFANLALRTELGLDHGDLMTLPAIVQTIVDDGDAHRDMPVKIPCQTGRAVRVRVSPVKNGLIMAAWQMLKT